MANKDKIQEPKPTEKLEQQVSELAQEVAETKKEAPKKKKGVIRSFFGSFFNVKAWIAYDEIAYNGKWILDTFKLLFSKPKKLTREELNETFADAAARMELSEEDIKYRTKQFLLMTILYAAIAFILFGYEIYLLIAGAPFLSLIMNLALIALMGAYAYRESFWYMQMQKRKLGCTYEEWREFMLRRILK